jgi:hypothetical protein
MKQLTGLLVVLLLLAGTGSAAFAASARCVVVEAEGNKLVLECERGTDGFEPGREVKIKAERTGAAIEGC